MSIAAAATRRFAAGRSSPRHPNELDAMRISRAIETRERYRYVQPTVQLVENGYLVRSPCCSRKVDPEGGEIDVAWLEWDELRAEWTLLRKDHAAGCWLEDSRYARLGELLMRLASDPARTFWQ
ncbi:hypothetical protein B2G71_14870 [Novosphingobium sp. PC22D]|uniref:DUF3024 domain-containing protein n=1 Tax=Novosphingobium sp. PC22D TaxID=1962403 RepID=UPI000BF076D4|nr:hypothetical protein [Novosphingobium sp. PC22D]PEQ11735.1 hypothetical protein B2G71_14870 [Novosphingobium sp. PC22D]